MLQAWMYTDSAIVIDRISTEAPDLLSWRVEVSSRFAFCKLFVGMIVCQCCQHGAGMCFCPSVMLTNMLCHFVGVVSQPSISRIFLSVDDHKALTIVQCSCKLVAACCENTVTIQFGF